MTAACAVLQRNRAVHPIGGRFEAADLQWWWRTPRTTDDVDQLIWYDDHGPVAAAYLTDWTDSVGLDVLLPVDASSEAYAMVLDTGLHHAASLGIDRVDFEVARSDHAVSELLSERGFAVAESGLVECWIRADDRPPVTELGDGYHLFDRSSTRSQPSHWLRRNGPDVERRLSETTLYRDDLDLVVLDDHDDHVGYGLFWHDPTTSTGLVEPMRTEDDHQRRGIARHVLTAGLDRLARVGSRRIKICFEAGNTAARNLYLDVGFTPAVHTDIWAGPTATV